MKKKSKRLIALLLSFLIIISMIPTTELTVEAAAKPKLAKKSVSIVIGGTSKIKMKNVPKRAKITYRSAKKNIATVSKQGKVKGIKSGTTKITVSVKKNSKTTKLTYKVTVKKTKLSKSKLSLKSGNTAKLSVKNKPKKARYTWQSSNSKVATVNKNGKVVAKAKGTATIRVKVKTTKKTYSLSCKVTIKSTYDVKQTYTVTFDSNGGSSVASQTVDKNTLATRPTDPTRSGYTFDGWFTAASGGQKFDFNTAITGNITLYAHWTAIPFQEPTPTPVTYTVTFDSNGGSSVAFQTVTANGKVTQPTVPTKSGYTFDGWYTSVSGGTQFNFSTAITGNMTLYARWTEIVSEEPTPTSATYTVTFELRNPDEQNPSEQKIETGKYASQPNISYRNGYQFAGWFLNQNENDWSNTFIFESTPITSDITLYAIWVDITTDTDGDGLSDELEIYIHTDKNDIDTDGDGLTDYQEVTDFKYDPLNTDTDNDGINDAQEDYDNDGINNSDEIIHGICPASNDSDLDKLTDYDEIHKYYTNPTNEDTDSDGVSDSDEIEIGSDPLTAESQFEVTSTYGELSEKSPVSLEVSTTLTNEQFGTLDITPVTYSDNSFISPTIPGYLDVAFDITVKGSIDSAVLSFNYDDSLGSLSDDFQPRIYYFDENERTLAELDNQTVQKGVISATVNHFSTYILLNKAEFDKVWEYEIKPPFSDGESDNNASLNIMFVIDYSASMDDNDPKQMFKDLSKNFIGKLRDGKDRAGAVKFIERAYLISSLTANKTSVCDAIDEIEYDDGYGSYSGTDGSAGINMALNELSSSDSEYKYIVFITDGEDNQYTYSYDTLISSAKEDSVVIYTIGMGSANKDTLKKLATNTGGKYYHASATDTIDDVVDLDDVFHNIESETVDMTTDTNDDGIPDYFNDLIFKGELVLSNGSSEFAGTDFNYDANGNPSADWDSDGLKNGEELTIMKNDTTGKVYMVMKSDPMMEYSDTDKYSDYQEHLLGSDPLVPSYLDDHIDYPLNDSNFTYVNVYNNEDKWWNKDARNVWSSITLNWSHEDEATRLLGSFLSEYSNISTIEDVAEKTEKEQAGYFGSQLINAAQKLSDSSVEAAKDIGNIKIWISSGNSAKNLSSNHFTRLKAQIGLAKYNKTRVKWYSKLTDTTSKVGNYATAGLTLISEGLDVYEICNFYSSLASTADAFEKSVDILEYIKNNDAQKEKYVGRAATNILNVIKSKNAKFRNDKLWEISVATAENTASIALAFFSSNPYVAAINLAILGLDMLTPVSEIAGASYYLYVIDELVNASKNLFTYDSKQNGYYNIYEHQTRHLQLLICARMYGGEFAKTITKNQHYWGLFNDDKIRQEYANAINDENSRLESSLDILRQ